MELKCGGCSRTNGTNKKETPLMMLLISQNLFITLLLLLFYLTWWHVSFVYFVRFFRKEGDILPSLPPFSPFSYICPHVCSLRISIARNTNFKAVVVSFLHATKKKIISILYKPFSVFLDAVKLLFFFLSYSFSNLSIPTLFVQKYTETDNNSAKK